MLDAQSELRTWISRFATGEHDIANLLCERHADDPRRLALREDAAGQEEQLTYRELADLSARFATRLSTAGVGRGDRVATLLPKCPELLVAALGIWRLGAVHVPLFTRHHTSRSCGRLHYPCERRRKSGTAVGIKYHRAVATTAG